MRFNEINPKIWQWWTREVGRQVDQFAAEGSGAPHRRISYSNEDREVMRSMLAAPEERAGLETIDERQRGPYYIAVGKLLDLMHAWRLQRLEDLEIEVNLDPYWSRAHPGWERLLLRMWEDSSRKLCVWVRPKAK